VRKSTENDERILQVPATGGKAEPIIEGAFGESAWSPDGEKLYFMRAENIWALSLEHGTELPMTDLRGRKGGLGESLAVDEKHLYFSWNVTYGDIWVMDVVYE
jgi:hypothetical protein